MFPRTQVGLLLALVMFPLHQPRLWADVVLAIRTDFGESASTRLWEQVCEASGYTRHEGSGDFQELLVTKRSERDALAYLESRRIQCGKQTFVTLQAVDAVSSVVVLFAMFDGMEDDRRALHDWMRDSLIDLERKLTKDSDGRSWPGTSLVEPTLEDERQALLFLRLKRALAKTDGVHLVDRILLPRILALQEVATRAKIGPKLVEGRIQPVSTTCVVGNTVGNGHLSVEVCNNATGDIAGDAVLKSLGEIDALVERIRSMSLSARLLPEEVKAQNLP